MSKHRYSQHNIQSYSHSEQTAALRDYYENMTDENTHERSIKRYEFFSKKISPMLALTFVGIYW